MTNTRLSRRLIQGFAGSMVLSIWLAGAALHPAQADYLAAEAAMKANDLPRAVPLLAEEAKLGNPVAAYNLGKIYENGGDGVPQDYAQAIAWYKLAADVGTLPTQFNGQQLGPDAADLIFAAQLYAQFNLGRLYESGQGVEKDVATAVQWYARAAQQDLDVAQQHLVRIFRQGEGTVAPNPVESTKWLERLAQGGNVPAMTDLGTAYLQGVGVEKNAKIAHDWYLRGASLGSGEALFNLGLLYQSGYSGDADYKRAADYYTRAANKNSGRAMMALGDLYAKAQGVSSSRVQALAWYELAADRGVAEAVAKRDSMTRDMASDEVDQANTIAAAWQPQPDTAPLPEAVPPMPAPPPQPSLLPTAPSDQAAPALATPLPAPADTTAPQVAPDATTVPVAPPTTDNTGNQPVPLPTPDTVPAVPVPAEPAPAPESSIPAAPDATVPADNGAAPVPLVGTPQAGAKPFGADSTSTTLPKSIIITPTAPAPVPATPPAAPADPSQNNGTTNP
jgi:TPR repeat protein